MSVLRVQKNRNYTVMSNHHLRDKNLSLKAKGLMSMMLSLPDDWNYSIGGLCSICKENQTAIKSALKELKTHGYLITTKLTPDKSETGRIEWVYDLYEEPQTVSSSEDARAGSSEEEESDPEDEDPQREQEQHTENLPAENRRELNKDILNKDIPSKEEIKTDCMFESDRRTFLHSEVRTFFKVNDLRGDPEKFIDYYLYLPDDEFERKFRYLAKRWSRNEFVDLPLRMYDDQYRERVCSRLPEDLTYEINKDLDESDCMQIRYGTYERLVEYLERDDLGILGV